MRRNLAPALALALILLDAVPARALESTCYGTVSRGWLEGGVRLPDEGKNFAPYSSLGTAMGRTYVHAKVRDIIVDAYSALESAAPGKTFVYGETGWPSGGRIRPHRTHQNGLSVDFMVPVVEGYGRSVPLPTGVSNKFGYSVEFDAEARSGAYSIDFEALGEHLFQLQAAAGRRGAGIALVIFDPRFMPRLFKTTHGEHLKKTMKFMQRDAWVRHDEHYHVDFSVDCKPWSR